MPNQEIHNYIDEQLVPNETDYLDLDADIGSGNWLSKKLTFANLRKWLFGIVSQEVSYIDVVFGSVTNIGVGSRNVFVIDMQAGGQEITVSDVPYNNSATYLIHLHNTSGATHTLSNTFITTPENPDITTTVGGYAQVWITYHKKADNSEVWTANTINFS